MSPGGAVHVGQGLHVGRGEEEVDGLGLVDPLLASCCGQYKPTVVNSESGLVLELEVFGDGFDLVELAVEVLEVFQHLLAPEAASLEGVKMGHYS